MRIAYVAERDLSVEDAIVKKIASQMRCWREMGHDVALFALSPSPTVTTALDDIEVTQEHRRGWLDWLTRYRRLVDAVIAWQPSCAYFRFSSYFPPIGRLMQAAPTVVEVNTDDVNEYRSTMRTRTYAYHRLTRGKIFRRCRGVVTVTHALGESYRRAGHAVAVVPNAIDLSLFPELPAPQNDSPRLLFLGSANIHFHGVDQIIVLARQLPQWNFELVGPDRARFAAGTPTNVKFHGYLSRAEYEPIIARCDVSIGTLALHRNAMDEASSLKLREYLAYGFPSIIAYNDSDFPEGAPFLLQLPNEPDTALSQVEAIHEFVDRSRGTRVPRAAIEHLDIHVKEKQRMEFLSSICDDA